MTTPAPRRHRRLRTVAIVLGTLVALTYLGVCALAGHRLAVVFLHADAAAHDKLAAKVESAQSRIRLHGDHPLAAPEVAPDEGPDDGPGAAADAEPGGVPDAAPGGAPGAAPDPAPTPSAPPAVPATWGGTDAQAAEDAVGYFLDLLTYTVASGDTARWRDLSDPGCAYCARVADAVDLFYGNGGRVEGGTITVTEISASATDGAFDVRYTYRQDTTIALGPDGSAVGFLDPGGGEAALRVRPTWLRGEASWAIVEAWAPEASAPGLLGQGA